MYSKSLLLEMLVSGFFAVACLKARAGVLGKESLTLREFFRLTDRMDRLSRTRWQWFSMVLLLVIVRMQIGVPVLVELTALVQFVIFLALPVDKQSVRNKPARTVSRRPKLARSAS